MNRSEIAKMIDHTLLAPDATRDAIANICAEAREHRFGAVCIAPSWVPLAAELLRDSGVNIATVIGFPHGNTLQAVKQFEAREAISAGAGELDMVLNVGAMKSGRADDVLADIRGVTDAAGAYHGVLVKVILETGLLADDEKRLACRLAEEAGADFVKTSTGFGPGGATAGDVRLMRQAVGDRLGVKAAGGIRDRETAVAMIEAGASRLGCSQSVRIVREFEVG